MSTDGAGLSDEVVAELNPPPSPPPVDQPPRIPDRPADNASKAAWVDYAVALGADRSFLTGDTEHWEGDRDTGRTITVKALTKDELIDLAGRLGG